MPSGMWSMFFLLRGICFHCCRKNNAVDFLGVSEYLIDWCRFFVLGCILVV